MMSAIVQSSSAGSQTLFGPSLSSQTSSLASQKRDPEHSFTPQNVDRETILALYDTLSSLIYSPTSTPREEEGAQDALVDYFDSLMSPTPPFVPMEDWIEQPLPYPSLYRSREERHRVRFTHQIDECFAFRMTTILESPSREDTEMSWCSSSSTDTSSDATATAMANDPQKFDPEFWKSFMAELRDERERFEAAAAAAAATESDLGSSSDSHDSPVPLQDQQASLTDSVSPTKSRIRFFQRLAQSLRRL